jgi:hypothetical protein
MAIRATMFPEPSVKEWMPSASMAVDPLITPHAALALATSRFRSRICQRTLLIPSARVSMFLPAPE